jgi:molecular chaperone GrpE
VALIGLVPPVARIFEACPGPPRHVLVFLGERPILPPMHGESREGGDQADEAIAESGVSTPPSAPSSDVAEVADPLAQAQAEAAKLKDAWLRTAADFDNFRKRTRRELDEARRASREEVLRALLPIFDNLDRAIQSSVRSSDIKAMVDGLSMVHRQFVDALGREGITRVPTVGQSFDPSIHEAIQQVDTDEHPPGTVIAEVQSGYSQGDRLLRAAMVVVARGKAAQADGDEGGSDPAN